MLDVEERFVIKDLYRKGVSISDIARQTGHDRKTVRKIIATPLVAARPPRAPRVRKLDTFVPYLEQRVRDGVHNANKLLTELRQQGYQGGKTQLKDWLQSRRPSRTPPPTVRFETAPGEQAQADFAHFGTIQHQGRERRLYAFLMTLGFSRMLFVCFSVSCDWVAFLRGHLAAFQFFGGVPRTVLHDNLKSAVLERRSGQVHFHPRYLDFADYYGFSPRACQPYRAQTKGKVERSVQYVRGNFWPGLHFTSLDDLNAQARTWLDTVANVRVHATTGVTPLSRLGEEGLSSIAHRPSYEITPLLLRQASRDGWVRYAGNAYAIPLTYAGQPMLVKLTERDEVVITTPQGTPVASHARATAQGVEVGQPSHPPGTRTLPAATGVPPLPAPAASPPEAASPAPPSSAPQVEVRALAEYDVLLEEV
jgi:transposase